MPVRFLQGNEEISNAQFLISPPEADPPLADNEGMEKIDITEDSIMRHWIFGN